MITAYEKRFKNFMESGHEELRHGQSDSIISPKYFPLEALNNY